MNAELRRRLERAVRVRDFLRAHRSDGVAEGKALARLEELVQRAEALDGQQRAGVVATRASVEKRVEVRRALQSKLLKYLAAVGALVAQDAPDLGAPFRLPPGNASKQEFLTAARGMLELATARKEVLENRGMSEQLLTDLGATLIAFEETLESTRAARREHVGASADLRRVLAELSRQVRALDGLVRYRFGDNDELMGAWASARNVLGPFRPHAEPEVGGGEPGFVEPAA